MPLSAVLRAALAVYEDLHSRVVGPMITLRLTDSQDSPTNRVCQDYDQSGYVIHKAPVRYYHGDLNTIPTVMW